MHCWHVDATSLHPFALYAVHDYSPPRMLYPLCLQDYGMQRLLPDTTFLAEWKDRIEAVIITHGHEDHIGAIPWVIPALNRGVPIFAGPMAHELVARRMREYSIYNAAQHHVFRVRERFQAGPFECAACLLRRWCMVVQVVLPRCVCDMAPKRAPHSLPQLMRPRPARIPHHRDHLISSLFHAGWSPCG